MNTHNGRGVNILTYETDQRALREKLTRMETDYRGLKQRLSQIAKVNQYSMNPTLPNSNLHMNYPITWINYPVNLVNLGYNGYGKHQNLVPTPASMIPTQPHPLLIQNSTGQFLYDPSTLTSRTEVSHYKTGHGATPLPNHPRPKGTRPNYGYRKTGSFTRSRNVHSGH